MIQNGEEETEENAMLTSDKADEHLPLCAQNNRLLEKNEQRISATQSGIRIPFLERKILSSD